MGATVSPLAIADRNFLINRGRCHLVSAIDELNIRYEPPVSLRVLATRAVRTHCSPNVLTAMNKANLPRRFKRIILLEDL